MSNPSSEIPAASTCTTEKIVQGKMTAYQEIIKEKRYTRRGKKRYITQMSRIINMLGLGHLFGVVDRRLEVGDSEDVLPAPEGDSAAKIIAAVCAGVADTGVRGHAVPSYGWATRCPLL